MAITNLDDLKKNRPQQEPLPQPEAQPQQQTEQNNGYSRSQAIANLIGGNSGSNTETTTPTSPALPTSADKNYVAPVEQFNPYTTTRPQNVTESYSKHNDINITTQEYADDWQRRIIADHNGYITDESYQGALNKTLTDQAYNYIKRANNGADESAWSKPNPDDDLFKKYLPEIINTEEMRRQASEQMKAELPTQEQRYVKNVYERASDAGKAIIDAGDMEHGSWYLMSPLEKAKYLLVPGSNATTMDNAPWWTKFITNIAPSVMAGGAGAMLGSIIPIPGAGAVAGVAVGGLTYLQGVTGIEIPVISDVLSAIDLGEKVEPYFTGGISAISKAYHDKYGNASLAETIKSGDLDILDLAVTTADILKDPNKKYLWEVGKYGYEVGADAMDDILRTVRNAGAAVSDKVFGTDFGKREAGQVSRANIGRSGIEDLVEGTYGSEALIDTYLPLFTDFVNEAMKGGMTEKEAIQFAHENFQQYILNYTGTTGLVTDLAAQSVVDPANLAPFAQGKIVEGIGKITGDDALKWAGKTAAGNPLIDLLPPGIQQGAEGVLSLFQKNPNAPDILKTYGSQGFDVIKSVVKEAYRGTYDVDTLSGWQRYIAGIGKDGKISELAPNKTTGNAVKDWARNFFKTTNESKMFDVSQMTADFIGDAIFNKDVPLSYIPDLVEQAVGRKPIGDDSPLKQFRNSAMLRTLQDQFQGVSDYTINKITEDVTNYRKYNLNRQMVDQVSKTLNMTPTEIFDALDNKNLDEHDARFRNMTKQEKRAALDTERQDLYRKIREANITFTDESGKVYDAEQVIKKIEVFKKNTEGTKNNKSTKNNNWVGRKQYSETALKASIMTELADTADNYNLIRYNIKPDNWAVRTSNLMKSMQSIALLNFSTSYQVNNFLNNMLTRSVAGVGGIDPKFVNDVNKARGLTFTRGEGTTYEGTGKAINKAKKANDGLQKVNDMYDDISRKAVFKGVNNIDIEGMETTAAANIGFNRYWNATWGEMIPDLPKTFEALGITKDMKEQIYKIALDSPNVEAFRNTIMGEYAKPKAQSTLRQMLENRFDKDTAGKFMDYFSTKPWIQDMVDGFMESGDERIITKGFENLIDSLTNESNYKNLGEFASTFDDLRVTYANAGISAVATSFEALHDLYSKIWIDQTKENSTLFLDRITGRITPDDFDSIYKARMDIQTNDYNVARGYTLMNIGALIEGLGLDTKVGTDLMNNAMQIFDIGEAYIKEEHRLYQQLAKKDSPNYDFGKYYAQKLNLLEKVLATQTKASEAMNNIMIDYLRNNLGSEWTGHIDNLAQTFKEVLDLKLENNKSELADLKRRMNAKGKWDRMKVSREQERPRTNRKNEISRKYTEASRYLKAMEGAMGDVQRNTAQMTIEQTLRIEMMSEEAKNLSKRSQNFMRNNKDGKNSSKEFKPMNFENSQVKTTFVQYANEKIGVEAMSAGVDPKKIADQNSQTFHNGDAVTLGAVDATTHIQYFDETVGSWVDHPILDHFQLLNPNVDPKVTGGKFSMARSEPYLHGGKIVNAGVFEGGKVIAYITEGMPQSITVDGKTFPVIGVSPDDPNSLVLYVRDKSRTVTPGKPSGVEYTSYAVENFHPGTVESTPTILPEGRAALETSANIREVIRMWQEQAVSDLHKAQENGSFFGKLTPEQRLAVFEWMDGDLRQAYNAERYMTQRYGETMVDAALLNYNRRYGFDNMLTMLSPYQFWMTRSIANWGKRMISQPKWFAMYARLQKLIEKNKKDFLPSRLEGLVGLPMPNMGDGMGDAWFFDVSNTLLPFQQFYNMGDYFIGNLNTSQQNTMTQIDEMYANGQITSEQYDEAMQSKGDLYWKLFNQNRAEDESDTSMGGLMGTFFGYPVWFDALRKHLTGKDKSISYSPMFRLGNTIKATGDNTMLEDVTDFIGGTLQLPENGLRKLFGIESNPDGNYADYGILSNIARMQTEMEISETDALNAIAEGPGNKIYEEALYRYRQQNAQRMQGGALMTEIGQSLGGNKETSLGQIAGTALASVFGAKTFSDGERMHREQQQIYRDQISKLDKDTDAYKNFWKEFPDYTTYSYAYTDDPEERYHKILLDMLGNAYYDLPDEQRNLVANQLPDRFKKLFLDKETKAPNYLSNEEIIEWIRAMEGKTPNINDKAIDQSAQDAVNLMWYSDSAMGKYDRYWDYVNRNFPGWKEAQDGYYDTPEELRPQYLIDNPVLQPKWDYDEQVKRANPDLAVMLNSRSANSQTYFGTYDNITKAIMGRISSSVKTRLEDYIDHGWAIPAWAEQSLRTAYDSMIPYMGVNVPYDEWLKAIPK